MMWDNRTWKGQILEIGSYTLTCKFEAQLQSFSCLVTGVYASNCYIERRRIGRDWCCQRYVPRMKEFSDFKWRMKHSLDRISISEECDESFNNLKLIPPESISYHVPIALQGGTWNKNNRFFKFENWWLDTEGLTNRKALQMKWLWKHANDKQMLWGKSLKPSMREK
ncbi:hypothetical protein H5410_042417 [Solanum commersonii]|uniref:Uncharacterized protein n=1 Tax=Solanum commersonii TaxID=4109 RepID=A0A9J5XWB5_SOLCO|nr:hypothetical protein H5410_042417 [Solanum commersonii]